MFLVCLDILKSYDTTKPSVSGSTISGELPVDIYAQMQSFSYELSTLVAVSIYIYIYICKNSFTYTEDDNSSALRYLTGMKSAGF